MDRTRIQSRVCGTAMLWLFPSRPLHCSTRPSAYPCHRTLDIEASHQLIVLSWQLLSYNPTSRQWECPHCIDIVHRLRTLSKTTTQREAVRSVPGWDSTQRQCLSPTGIAEPVPWGGQEEPVALSQAEGLPGSLRCPVPFYGEKDPLEPGFRWADSHQSISTNVCLSLLFPRMRTNEWPAG